MRRKPNDGQPIDQGAYGRRRTGEDGNRRGVGVNAKWKMSTCGHVHWLGGNRREWDADAFERVCRPSNS